MHVDEAGRDGSIGHVDDFRVLERELQPDLAYVPVLNAHISAMARCTSSIDQGTAAKQVVMAIRHLTGPIRCRAGRVPARTTRDAAPDGLRCPPRARAVRRVRA